MGGTDRLPRLPPASSSAARQPNKIAAQIRSLGPRPWPPVRGGNSPRFLTWFQAKTAWRPGSNRRPAPTAAAPPHHDAPVVQLVAESLERRLGLPEQVIQAVAGLGSELVHADANAVRVVGSAAD
jgi:hypothetical protein